MRSYHGGQPHVSVMEASKMVGGRYQLKLSLLAHLGRNSIVASSFYRLKESLNLLLLTGFLLGCYPIEGLERRYA